MKKLIVLSIILFVAFSTIAIAQVPQKVNYQAVVRDAAGKAITDKTISLRISILRGSAFGTYIYVETHSPLTNQFGLVTLAIGNGTIISGSFSGIDWSTGSYFLKVELDASGGTSYSEMGTTQLLSVPYSLFSQHSQNSETSEEVINVDYDQLTNKPDLSAFLPVSGSETWDKDSSNDVTITRNQTISGEKTFQGPVIVNNSVVAGINNPTGIAITAENMSGTGSTPVIYAGSYSNQGIGVKGISSYIGLYGGSASSTGIGYGVYGAAASGLSSGVYGYNSNPGGMGVSGIISSTSAGEGSGVFGSTANSGGTGVRGTNTAYSGVTYGVHGTVMSTNGRAVYGEALNASGTNMGVMGTTNSPSGYAIYGNNYATTGNAYGIFGTTASSTGRALTGYASSSTGINYGVYAKTESSTGYGVYALADASSGTNYGVYGEAKSTQGIGIYGIATALTGSTRGVYGMTNSSSGTGVYGISTNDNGYNFGVYGITYGSSGGTGVFGIAYDHSGLNFGVRGNSNSTSGYDFYADGNGVNYGSSSSIRWKKDIVPITNVLAKIQELRGVYFEWDEEHGGYHDLGFIGEEVAKYFPEVVAIDPGAPEYVTGMDYSKMTPILLQAIKEQQVIIETQNKQILDLLKRVEALETK